MKYPESSSFTYDKLEEFYRSAINCGYRIVTCSQYAKSQGRDKVLVNRVDVDISLKKAKRVAEIFDGLGIQGTFFIRLHADEYNPFSFENFRILKSLRDSGHEIGYHSEVVDAAIIWNEDAEACLKRDIRVIEEMLEIKVEGAASHGGRTGYNNLDFWKNRSASSCGLLYEAYEEHGEFELFKKSLYVSDSEWTRWKCYMNGVLSKDDRRTPVEHLEEHPKRIYLLIHAESFYDEHCYE